MIMPVQELVSLQLLLSGLHCKQERHWVPREGALGIAECPIVTSDLVCINNAAFCTESRVQGCRKAQALADSSYSPQ